MPYLINGVEHELNDPKISSSDLQIDFLKDRMLLKTKKGSLSALIAKKGDITYISCEGQVFEIKKISKINSTQNQVSSGEFRAPIPGQIVDILVEANSQVITGQKLLILEAMKTQYPVVAPFSGQVIDLSVELGTQVSEGDLLIKLRPSG